MAGLRRTKLLCATILVCAGAVCVTLGDMVRGSVVGVLVGAVLIAVGVPMLVRQWTGKGVLYHAAAALLRLVGSRAHTRYVAAQTNPRPEPVGDA